ncbi:hypothetical protein JTB14_015923 [Gonioctena quinquepunctata]|nr:hypothetical protein JTB14_015923 [Gonioctena quinquepunctata]
MDLCWFESFKMVWNVEVVKWCSQNYGTKLSISADSPFNHLKSFGSILPQQFEQTPKLAVGKRVYTGAEVITSQGESVAEHFEKRGRRSQLMKLKRSFVKSMKIAPELRDLALLWNLIPHRP